MSSDRRVLKLQTAAQRFAKACESESDEHLKRLGVKVGILASRLDVRASDEDEILTDTLKSLNKLALYAYEETLFAKRGELAELIFCLFQMNLPGNAGAVSDALDSSTAGSLDDAPVVSAWIVEKISDAGLVVPTVVSSRSEARNLIKFMLSSDMKSNNDEPLPQVTYRLPSPRREEFIRGELVTQVRFVEVANVALAMREYFKRL